MMTMTIPVSLQKADGSLRDIPKAARSALACPKCGATMERGRTGWGCPRVLGHVAIRPDETVIRAIETAIAPYVHPTDRLRRAVRNARTARRVVRCRMRLGIAPEAPS